MDSHSSVLKYQMCAFLLTLAAVYYLVRSQFDTEATRSSRFGKPATTGPTAMTAISVIVGSTREGRFSEKPAQ
jgi:hypothetical protein